MNYFDDGVGAVATKPKLDRSSRTPEESAEWYRVNRRHLFGRAADWAGRETTSEEDRFLDAFFTKPHVASQCYAIMREFITDHCLLIEPSAGGGAFLDAVTDHEIVGFDICPKHPKVLAADFFEGSLLRCLPPAQRALDHAALGNPPYGTDGKKVRAFLNGSLRDFGLVGFCMPALSRKWSFQKHVLAGARLIYDADLPEQSYTFRGREMRSNYDFFRVLGQRRPETEWRLTTCFQVWTTAPGEVDLRLKAKPPNQHPDFTMRTYNHTPQTWHHVTDHNWHFAVPRQMSADYHLRITDPADCDRNVQYMMFKAHSPEALARLLALDFAAISKLNTVGIGYGMAEVVQAYQQSQDE